MTSLDAVTAWIDRYRRAWEANDPRDIAGLFAEDAAYFTEPYAKPWLGRDAIPPWLAPGTLTKVVGTPASLSAA